MALDTFANLKSAIADELDRDDLTSQIPQFITLAEARHKRDIRIKEMINRSSITVDSRQISLPTGILETISFRLLTNPVTVLRYVDYHEMNRVRQETSGQPQYFTLANEIEFDVTPDSSYSGEIIYYKEETPLSDSNTSNNILSEAPDAYLYGALMASAPHLMEDTRLAVWTTLYKETVRGLDDLRRKSRASGHMVSRVAGPTP